MRNKFWTFSTPFVQNTSKALLLFYNMKLQKTLIYNNSLSVSLKTRDRFIDIVNLPKEDGSRFVGKEMRMVKRINEISQKYFILLDFLDFVL